VQAALSVEEEVERRLENIRVALKNRCLHDEDNGVEIEIESFNEL
jgi:hypothetical protein